MIAAIYARKSTEQNGADADAKSVARQIESARAFAAAKGWTVAEAHVYADDVPTLSGWSNASDSWIPSSRRSSCAMARGSLGATATWHLAS